MDAVTGVGDEPSPGRRVRIAAFKSGIGPGEPLEPIIDELAKFADKLPAFRKEIEDVIGEAKQPFKQSDMDLLAKQASESAFRASERYNAEKLAEAHKKHVMTFAGFGVAAIVAAFVAGYGVRWWTVPVEYKLGQFLVLSDQLEQCHDQGGGMRVCNMSIIVDWPGGPGTLPQITKQEAAKKAK